MSPRGNTKPNFPKVLASLPRPRSGSTGEDQREAYRRRQLRLLLENPMLFTARLGPEDLGRILRGELEPPEEPLQDLWPMANPLYLEAVDPEMPVPDEPGTLLYGFHILRLAKHHQIIPVGLRKHRVLDVMHLESKRSLRIRQLETPRHSIRILHPERAPSIYAGLRWLLAESRMRRRREASLGPGPPGQTNNDQPEGETAT